MEKLIHAKDWCPSYYNIWEHLLSDASESFTDKNGYISLRKGVCIVCIDPLKTSPEYTQAGVYGKCVL